MKLSHIKTAVVLLLCVLISSIALSSCSTTTNSNTTEPTVIELYTWPGYTLEEAVDAADHIVYGRVIQKDNNIQRQDISGDALVENDLEIEVIDLLKASEVAAPGDRTLAYHEIPNPTAERNDIPLNLEVGQEVILFLNPHSRVLGPDYVIPVEEDRVQLSSYLMQTAEVSDDASLSVEDFCKKLTD